MNQDVLKAIMKDLNVTIRQYHSVSGVFGVYNKDTKEWDGLMQELITNKVDLVVSDLMITFERSMFIDFVYPFIHVKPVMAILSKTSSLPTWTNFVVLFHESLWIGLGCFVATSSCFLFLLNKKSWKMVKKH